MDNTCIRLASAADAKEIESLRIEGYRSSPDFSITDESFIELLRWKNGDENAHVLTVWRDGNLIATMRAEFIQDINHAAIQFDGMMPPADHAIWPSLVLTRASTRAKNGKAGLNSLMRLYFIKAAMENNLQRLYGYVAMGGTRTKLMASLGYEFLTRPDEDPYHPSHHPWAIAWLDLQTRGAKASSLLEKQVSPLQDEYPWVGQKLCLAEKS